MLDWFKTGNGLYRFGPACCPYVELHLRHQYYSYSTIHVYIVPDFWASVDNRTRGDVGCSGRLDEAWRFRSRRKSWLGRPALATKERVPPCYVVGQNRTEPDKRAVTHANTVFTMQRRLRLPYTITAGKLRHRGGYEDGMLAHLIS